MMDTFAYLNGFEFSWWWSNFGRNFWLLGGALFRGASGEELARIMATDGAIFDGSLDFGSASSQKLSSIFDEYFYIATVVDLWPSSSSALRDLETGRTSKSWRYIHRQSDMVHQRRCHLLAKNQFEIWIGSHPTVLEQSVRRFLSNQSRFDLHSRKSLHCEV